MILNQSQDRRHEPVTVTVSIRSEHGRARVCVVGNTGSPEDDKRALQAVGVIPDDFEARLEQDVDLRARGVVGQVRYYPSSDDFKWIRR